jgi:hypothetical protein
MAKRIIYLGMLVIVLAFGMTVVGCEEEVKGGTIKVTNTSAETYEVRIINGSGERTAGNVIAAYASRNFSVDNDDSYTVEYRIFWTSDTWKSKYAYVSNGNTVTAYIP